MSNNTAAICDAMSIINIFDEYLETRKPKTFSDIEDELKEAINNIKDKDIREHFITLMTIRIDKYNNPKVEEM